MRRRELKSPALEQGPVAGSCEHGNKSSGFVKDGKFLDYHSDCQLLKNDSVSCILKSIYIKGN
jgi:hypothetical protein